MSHRVLMIVGLACFAWAGLTPMGAARAATEDPWGELDVQIRDLGLDPEVVRIPGRPSPEMKEWVHARVSANESHEVIVRRVLEALVDPQGFKLLYDPGFTGTAQEIWALGRANCLGFTHLFVGLTRELGVPTYYVRWSRVERFRREGDLVLVSGHVSAGLGAGSQRQVLEFGAVEGYEAHQALPISDLNAMARHYANRGAEHLRTGDIPAAVEAAKISTVLDPGLADAWVNLGVALRRSGNTSGAEEAYRQATLVDPDHLAAYQNLSVLMYIRGDEDAARKTLALLDRRDNKNPYIYLSLGDDNLDMGRYEEAARFYRRAHHLGSGLAETRAAMGAAALALGDRTKARKWLRKAQAVDPQDDRTLELAESLSRSWDPSK